MPCYHPIEAFDVTRDFENSTDREVIFSLHEYWLDHPFFSQIDCREKLIRQGRRLMLPCRKCIGCRLAKSREWANRAVMEQLYHDQCWFLTLTYDDEHLPPAFPVDDLTGEILSVHATLVKKNLQDFFKRLRKNTGQQFRYYAAGEYGSQSYRPHYHVLLFGLKLNDLSVISKNFAGQPYYVSDMIQKCWTAGIHILGPVTWQSASYVAQYTMKKATHGFSKEYYEKAAIVPEYQTMSLKPGIGFQYYFNHPDIFDYNYFDVQTPQGGRRMTPPEYFKKKYREEHPKEYLKRSLDMRKEVEVREHLKMLLTDKDYCDILKDEERKCFSRLSTLTRDDI